MKHFLIFKGNLTREDNNFNLDFKNLTVFALAIYRSSETAPYFEGIEIWVFNKANGANMNASSFHGFSNWAFIPSKYQIIMVTLFTHAEFIGVSLVS